MTPLEMLTIHTYPWPTTVAAEVLEQWAKDRADLARIRHSRDTLIVPTMNDCANEMVANRLRAEAAEAQLLEYKRRTVEILPLAIHALKMLTDPLSPPTEFYQAQALLVDSKDVIATMPV
jgi:hypothetical protein